MFISNFIYFYIAVCVLIIVFEISWKRYIIIKDKIIEKRKKIFKKHIIEEMESYESIKHFSRKHFTSIEYKLRKTNNLIAFEKACDEISKERDMNLYFTRMIDVFENLARFYDKKSDDKKAFFVTVIRKYYINYDKKEKLEELIKLSYSFLKSESIYCKINTMEFIVQIGNTENVIRVLDIINNSKNHFNSVLLADGLKKIKHNREKLAQKMFERFDTYNKYTQIAIIKFLTENPYIDEVSILDKLSKKTLDTDVRCEIMRYFQENKTESAKRYLMKQLNKSEIVANDLNIKAIGTLGYYDDLEVRDLLTNFTKSNDELIKESAYKSLEKNQALQNKKIKIAI